MIKIERKGTTVQMNVTCPRNNYTYYFTYECGAGKEDYAILLRETLADGLFNRIKNLRAEQYDKGHKDAKKKTRKETWFSGYLE